MTTTVRVLYVGDTQVEVLTASKGIDSFTHTYYKDTARILRESLAPRPGIELTHMTAADASMSFPATSGELGAWDVIILSDVGYNNLALQPGARELRVPMGPNRVKALHQWVLDGGGLIMAGGYLTFSGIEGKGRYRGTVIEELLPVVCDLGDDRIESPEGVGFTVVAPAHPIVEGIEFDPERIVLGYNHVTAKEDSVVLATIEGDPFIVLGEAGRGRSLAYTTDPVLHWSGDLHLWDDYGLLWERMCKWAGGRI